MTDIATGYDRSIHIHVGTSQANMLPSMKALKVLADEGDPHVEFAAGDSKFTWDSEDAADVANAKATFNRLKADGYRMNVADKSGAPGRTISEFDPSVERIVATHQSAGG